ncbi:MAG: transposase [Crocinitomicaceae bacterium]|jgi:transposase-like protein|nr:transposase [Crocinitomicaceae bacterium]
MSKKTRRTFSAEQKALAVKRHFLEGVSSSEICEELQIHPNLFADWRKVFFENGASAFKRDKAIEQRESEKKINQLQNQISKKDRVISEIMSEYVDFKKKLGET